MVMGPCDEVFLSRHGQLLVMGPCDEVFLSRHGQLLTG
jgi:hypothetical protein